MYWLANGASQRSNWLRRSSSGHTMPWSARAGGVGGIGAVGVAARGIIARPLYERASLRRGHCSSRRGHSSEPARSKPRTTTVVPTRTCRAALRCFTMQALLAAAVWCQQPVTRAAWRATRFVGVRRWRQRRRPAALGAEPGTGAAAARRRCARAFGRGAGRSPAGAARPRYGGRRPGGVPSRRHRDPCRSNHLRQRARPCQRQRQRAGQPRRQPLLGP